MKLANKRVAILATNGFEESELQFPREQLQNKGAIVDIVSEKNGTITSWKDGNWANEYRVDRLVSEASVKDYNALVLPGGVINPDKLRRNKEAVSFVRDFFKDRKPVAAICHGPWLLAEAGVLENRKVTSFESIKKDLENSGANWVDEEVVVDNGLITSRSPEDLEAFTSKLVEEILEGKHEEQTV